MKVLMISGDKNILVVGSPVHARFALQKAQVEQLDVFVWPRPHSQVLIWRAMRKTHYDVVTSQDPFWRGLLAWKLARAMKISLNIQVHTDLSAQSFFRRCLAKFVLRRADSVRVVSEKIQEQVIAMGVHVPTYVLPIFADIEPFRALVAEAHPQKTILWIGRFEAEKGPLEAISVLRQVREAGIEAKLVMLGSGSLDPVLRVSAKGLPVEFPGWQDPKPYLQIADVVLCTSLHESWGASIVESLAAGVPVVAPDVGVAREVGATVVPRAELASAVTQALCSGERGVLKISMPSAAEWTVRWKETLV